MPVRVLLSRRIHRTLDPPLDHGSLRRRVGAACAPLLGRGRKAQICLLVCSDRVMRDINREWLGRDRTTSVIAFPSPALASHTAESGPLMPRPGILDPLVHVSTPPVHLGDIAVSVDTARREGGQGGRDERVAYLAFHGLLHILGWDHDDDRSWQRMHEATGRLLGHAP